MCNNLNNNGKYFYDISLLKIYGYLTNSRYVNGCFHIGEC